MHEMNLVLHPSSADRYVPAQTSSKSKRRGTPALLSTRTANTPPRHRPLVPDPRLPRRRPGAPRSPSARAPLTPLQTGTSTPSLSAHAPYPPQPPPQAYFAPDYAPYGPAPAPDWAYPPPGPAPPVDRSAGFPPPILPSIHAFGRPAQPDATPNAGAGWPPEGAAPDQELPYRAWAPDAAYAPSDAHVDPALRSDPREWPAPYGAPPPDEQQQASYQYTQPAVPYPPYAQPPPPGSPVPVLSAAAAGPALPLPRHTYTRTLVGPLSANACRLLDEHRKPGIFFLFQDLSVRTEGSFRLRMRLMNVGACVPPSLIFTSLTRLQAPRSRGRRAARAQRRLAGPCADVHGAVHRLLREALPRRARYASTSTSPRPTNQAPQTPPRSPSPSATKARSSPWCVPPLLSHCNCALTPTCPLAQSPRLEQAPAAGRLVRRGLRIASLDCTHTYYCTSVHTTAVIPT